MPDNALSVTLNDTPDLPSAVLQALYRITGRSSGELRRSILAGEPVEAVEEEDTDPADAEAIGAVHAKWFGAHPPAATMLVVTALLRLAGGEPLQPFEPNNQGSFVSLGGLMAVGEMNLPGHYRVGMTGIPAHQMKMATHLRWQLGLHLK